MPESELLTAEGTGKTSHKTPQRTAVGDTDCRDECQPSLEHHKAAGAQGLSASHTIQHQVLTSGFLLLEGNPSAQHRGSPNIQP